MEHLFQNEAFVFWAAVTLMVAVPVISHYWYRVRRAEIDAALKKDMIERGMSADEIVQVLRAGKSRGARQEVEEED